MDLIPNEPLHLITLGEAGYFFIFVLPYASGEVRCRADIERSIALACEDIYVGLFHCGDGKGDCFAIAIYFTGSPLPALRACAGMTKGSGGMMKERAGMTRGQKEVRG